MCGASGKNLRIPRDYDTSPLWLFWGLCFVWIMPWSAFIFKAVAHAVPLRWEKWRDHFRRHDLPLRRRGLLFLVVWSAFVLLFFSLSTRQEYYVLPALPGLAILIAAWVLPEHETTNSRANLRITTVLLILGTIVAAFSFFLIIRAGNVAPNTDLASLLNQNPADYALSMGHFMDLTGPSIALFRFPLAIAELSLFLGPLAVFVLIRRTQFHAANIALSVGAFGFLIAVFLGLRIFSPVLTSAQLAEAIVPQVQKQDLIIIHGEYESGSTLGFYLQRSDIHILDGRSSNLWYGSFFPDAPHIFETPDSLAEKWARPQRIFLWQSLTDPPNTLPVLPGPVYVLVKSGGKEIISNQPNR